jgi:hypothetical protein
MGAFPAAGGNRPEVPRPRKPRMGAFPGDGGNRPRVTRPREPRMGAFPAAGGNRPEVPRPRKKKSPGPLARPGPGWNGTAVLAYEERPAAFATSAA